MRELSPREAKCFNRGFVDRKPIDFRSTSRDIVTALGSAEFTRSTREGVGSDACDVEGEGS